MSEKSMPELSNIDIEALASLVALLDAMPVMSRSEARALSDIHADRVTEQMIATGESWGAAVGMPSLLTGGQEHFEREWRRIQNALGDQVTITRSFVEARGKTGDVVPPSYATRITVILRKAKRFDLERDFLRAYMRHYFDHVLGASSEKLNARAVKLGVDPFSLRT